MPEGDTIHRAAAALRTALVGRPVTRFQAPRLVRAAARAGRVVELVESHGKHLEIVWDDGLVLHTHMRMTGSWHLYRIGEPWRKPDHQMRVVIEVPEWVAVCFNAPVVETYREFDIHRHPGFGRLGPDLCTAPVKDLERCAAAHLRVPRPRGARSPRCCSISTWPAGSATCTAARSCGRARSARSHTVQALEPADCVQIINAASPHAARQPARTAPRVTNRDIPGGLAVYGRNGQRCVRCSDTVQVKRLGEHARLVYWCPGCQTRLAPQRDVTPSAIEMDPHPAAAKYLSELPWRRDIAG